MAARSTEAGSELPASAAETSTVKYYYSKRNDSTMESRRQALGRQTLPDSVFGVAPPSNGQFEPGAFYEIDHEKLPPKSPIQLKAIRIVKVMETTKLDVTVSFPSTLSLRNYFSFYPTDGHEPELDERFVMSLNHAVRILRSPVPRSTWGEEKHMESFWLVASRAYDCQPPPEAVEEEDKPSNPMGCCLSALKGAGTLGWGIRRKVKYIGRHRELPMPEKDEEEEQQVGQKRTREACKEEKKKRKKKKEDKRERKKPRHEKEKEKKRKCVQENRVKVSKDRWSSERYEAAEMKLLEIMREKGAALGNPVLRQALREEARKHIGDTGLLDHLLKHMDGKTVAGGTERFRRRHNAEGAMEYWLEPAELVEIRRKAGVMDPYWVPPPGWKPGDAVSPCLCGTECRREISVLRDEISVLKRDFEQLSSLKNLEKVIKEVRSETGAWQVVYQSLLESNSKMEGKMAGLFGHLAELKEEIRLLKDEKKMEMEAEIAMKDTGGRPDAAGDDGGKEKEGAKKGKQEDCKNTLSTKSGTTNDNSSNGTTISTPPTTIADANNNININNNDNGSAGSGGGRKTVRRSGFRICKPQGTFLWPNSSRNGGDLVMSSLPRGQGVMVPAATTSLDDQLVLFGGIPTPPSASSATSAPNLLLLPPPTSPVLPRVPASAAAADVVVVPSSYQYHQRQQQQQQLERTASSENICPPVYHHHRHHTTARVRTTTSCCLHLSGTSSPLGVEGGDNNKMKEASWELADGRGWSNITTDLALATPSSSSSYR